MEGTQPKVRRVELHDTPQCNCDTDCPGFSVCSCITVYTNSHGTCYITCGPGVPDPIPATLANLGLDQMIDLSVREVPLSRLGLMLASICTADIFVPALDLDKPMTLYLRRVTLGTAIQDIGLIARDRAD